ncbi:MAG: hypothetical protein ACJ72E_15875 [Marmoricola sp.]
MSSTKKWAARGAALGLAATALTGVMTASAGSASALGSTCTPPGQRPHGPITTALRPIIGDAGYNDGIIPLPEGIFAVTGTLDAVVCPLLP